MLARNLRSCLAIALCTAIVVNLGCGGGTDFGEMGSITGKLTMDGESMPAGTQLLFMQMTKGYAAFGKTDPDGNYSIEWMREGKTWNEVPAGSYKVLIQPPEVKNTEELSAEEMLEGKDEDLAPQEPVFPARYQQHATSGLEFDVKAGENTIDIDLKSE